MVKVILKQDMDHLGSRGDVVDVKAGHARNYLLPQGLAYQATEGNVQRIEDERRRSEETSKRDYLEARRRASQLSETILVFQALAGEGEEGKLFGSVTNADIADRLNEAGGLDYEVDRRQVDLEEPIKRLGEFSVPLRLHPDVQVMIEVRVERSAE